MAKLTAGVTPPTKDPRERPRRYAIEGRRLSQCQVGTQRQDGVLLGKVNWPERLAAREDRDAMKIVAIVQARMGSTRLPNKVMRPICGTPMIGLLLERLARRAAHRPDRRGDLRSIRATSRSPSYVRGLGYAVYRGSENDVLDRYYQAARRPSADVVVRITGDCPLVDPALVDA